MITQNHQLYDSSHDVVSEDNDGIEAIKKYYFKQPEIIFLDLIISKPGVLSVLKNSISRLFL